MLLRAVLSNAATSASVNVIFARGSRLVATTSLPR
jgi:hypothetical protein